MSNADFNGYQARPDWITVTAKYAHLGDGGVMPTTHYEALAFHQSRLALIGWIIALDEYDVWRTSTPPKGYRYGYTHKQGVVVGFGGEKQGWCVQLQGKWWAEPSLNRDNVRYAIEKFNGHITRFDFAVTYAMKGWENVSQAEALSEMIESIKRATNRTTPRLSIPEWVDPLYRTFRYASRRSAKHIRIYDKDYFNVAVGRSLRVEMEYKRRAAPIAYQWWLQGLEGHIIGDIALFLVGKEHAYQLPFVQVDGVRYEAIPSADVKPQHSDRAKWFDVLVKKAFERWFKDEPLQATQWLTDRWNDIMDG